MVRTDQECTDMILSSNLGQDHWIADQKKTEQSHTFLESLQYQYL